MKNIDLNDPRLTDYALDEMEPAQRAEFEKLLRSDPGAQKVTEEIRATARSLRSALEAEPCPLPAAERSPAKAAIIAGPDFRKLDGGPLRPTPRAVAKVLRFPQLYFVLSGLAAACFAIFFLVQERPAADPGAGRGMVQHLAKSRAEVAAAKSAAPGIAIVVADREGEDETFFSTAQAASSTFPLQISTASFADVREQLRLGLKPERATVHVAEMVNAFAYAWPAPAAGEGFATILEEAEAPWAPGHRLVRVGLRSAAPAHEARVLVEFDPARVSAWRLIGFEREPGAVGVRGLRSAGDTLLAGQAMTALYEIVPAAGASAAQPLLRLTLRYRGTNGSETHTQQQALAYSGARFADASEDFRFAAAVTAFGLILRESPHRGAATLSGVLAWSEGAGGRNGERGEFAALVQRAQGVIGE